VLKISAVMSESFDLRRSAGNGLVAIKCPAFGADLCVDFQSDEVLYSLLVAGNKMVYVLPGFTVSVLARNHVL